MTAGLKACATHDSGGQPVSTGAEAHLDNALGFTGLKAGASTRVKEKGRPGTSGLHPKNKASYLLARSVLPAR